MKFKKLIIRILLLIISIFLVIGSANSFAANGVKNFKLSTKRYVWEDGEYKEKGEYLLNTTLPRHKIYQILSVENQNNIVFDGTGYYCLNAVAGAWSGDVSTDTAREYNKSYNLDTDLEKLASENSSNEVYSGLANNPNIKEIIWLLDNIYIPKKATTDAEKEENLKNKQELLARAGIVYKEIILETGSGEQERFNVYKYENQKIGLVPIGKEGRICSAYDIVYSNGRYYMLGADINLERSKKIKYLLYRVDLMTDVSITRAPATSREEAGLTEVNDLYRFRMENPYMFAGETKKVKIRIDSQQFTQVVDAFGDDHFRVVGYDANEQSYYDIEMRVNLNSFLFWVLQYSGCVQVLDEAGKRKEGEESFRERVRETLRETLKKYEDPEG